MKSIKAIIIILFTSLPAFAQEETVDLLLDEFLFGKNARDSVLEAILLNETDINDLLDAVTNYKFIYARSEFENRTFFSGQDLGIEQYNIANQVFYQGPDGLNLGAAGIIYSGFKPKYSTSIASAGYNNRIRTVPGASIRAGYNRFFFAMVDSIEENSFNSSVNLGSTYRLKQFCTSVDFSLLIGKDPSLQFSWDLFSDLTILRIGLFDKLRFVPEISLYFGNETVVASQYISLPRFTD
jgi:hypothetical protein